MGERTVIYLDCVQTVHNDQDVFSLPWHAISGEKPLASLRPLRHAVRRRERQTQLRRGQAGVAVHFQREPAEA